MHEAALAPFALAHRRLVDVRVVVVVDVAVVPCPKRGPGDGGRRFCGPVARGHRPLGGEVGRERWKQRLAREEGRHLVKRVFTLEK